MGTLIFAVGVLLAVGVNAGDAPDGDRRDR